VCVCVCNLSAIQVRALGSLMCVSKESALGSLIRISKVSALVYMFNTVTVYKTFENFCREICYIQSQCMRYVKYSLSQDTKPVQNTKLNHYQDTTKTLNTIKTLCMSYVKDSHYEEDVWEFVP